MTDTRFISYNELSVKPADNDVFAIFDIDANELKKFEYSTLKSFFVKTNEATDISADHEVQTGNYLYFGSLAECSIGYDGTDFIFTSTGSTAKLALKVNDADFLVLDPVENTIKAGTAAFNYDGTAGTGINFDSSNRPVLLSTLQCNANIAAKLRNISYSGNTNTGLEFDSSDNGIFMQGLTATGATVLSSTLAVAEQVNLNKTGSYSLVTAGRFSCGGDIILGGNYIGYNLGAGLVFDVTNKATFSVGIVCTQLGANLILSSSYVDATTYIQAGTRFQCGGSNGITYNGAISTLNIKGGIIIGYT